MVVFDFAFRCRGHARLAGPRFLGALAPAVRTGAVDEAMALVVAFSVGSRLGEVPKERQKRCKSGRGAKRQAGMLATTKACNCRSKLPACDRCGDQAVFVMGLVEVTDRKQGCLLLQRRAIVVAGFQLAACARRARERERDRDWTRSGLPGIEGTDAGGTPAPHRSKRARERRRAPRCRGAQWSCPDAGSGRREPCFSRPPPWRSSATAAWRARPRCGRRAARRWRRRTTRRRSRPRR